MKLLLLDENSKLVDGFERKRLDTTLVESWLQERLFDHPELLPLAALDLADDFAVPVCRELAIPKATGSVFLDILFVTGQGRLVLVECKLWRNPHARREVVAQILEYAALLRRWSYADLTARLKAKRGWSGRNPLYHHYVSMGGNLPEADFSDAVARNLRSGDFQLLIAGDGIREDMDAIGELMRNQGARLALVEFQLWRNGKGQTLIVPHLPFRTEILRQRIVTDAMGVPVELASDDTEDNEATSFDPDKANTFQGNRAFWQKFIDQVSFDHPDQPRPRHGGNNWVRIPLPSPAKWLSAYRYKDLLGLSLAEEKGTGTLELFLGEADNLREETGLPGLRFHHLGKIDGPPALGIDAHVDDFASDEERIAWLCETSNKLVNALRPRLTAMADDI